MPRDNFPHIVLPEPPDRLGFTSISKRGAEKRIPRRNRQNHAEFLKRQLEQAWQDAENEVVVMHSEREGIYLEFKGSPGYDLILICCAKYPRSG